MHVCVIARRFYLELLQVMFTATLLSEIARIFSDHTALLGKFVSSFVHEWLNMDFATLQQKVNLCKGEEVIALLWVSKLLELE